MPTPSGILLWAHASQVALLSDVVRRLDRPVVQVGGPTDADAHALRDAFGDVVTSDLRHAVRTHAAGAADDDAPAVGLIVVATTSVLEPAERESLRDARVPVVSLEPRPSRLADFIAERAAGDGSIVQPTLRRTDGWAAAQSILDAFGPVHLVEIGCHGRPEHGSVLARLHDAMDVLDAVVAHPASVAAATDTGPGAVPEHLTGWRGSLSGRIRGAEGWSATVSCTSEAPRWARRVVLVGPGGRVTITDDDVTWIGPDGGPVDDTEPTIARPVTAEAADPGAAALAHAAQAALAGAGPVDDAARASDAADRRFALCEAVRLAARTGESERPARLFDIVRGSKSS